MSEDFLFGPSAHVERCQPLAAPLIGVARQIAEALRRRGLRLATAESCTGGMVAACVTALPGSSQIFEGAVVSYSNELKVTLLDVNPDEITRCGAVSAEVARAMAQGACARLGADVSLAVTGVAGPGGGRPGKPVGTVWIAWTGQGVEARARRYLFPGTRAAIRAASVRAALVGLEEFLGAAFPVGPAR